MGTKELFLCIFLGHSITAQSVIRKHDSTFFHDVPRFFDNIVPFPFPRNHDFTPYDTIFNPWRTRNPAFHMLADLPPFPMVPRVEVFCDESKLTILVDKRLVNGVALTEEEVQLGDGCYSNRELPNQLVFTYGLDQCGTTHVMQNGLMRFTNALRLNLKKPSHTWWTTPFTVHISCIPKRSYPNFFDSTPFPENSKTFNFKAMNSSWSSTAESNIYERGQVVNLQISTKTRSEQQQLFIQSCFVSASPEPQTRPKHAVIMNKGCTTPLGSSNAAIQFVVSDRADVVNFVLNTSYLISELYIHCSVLLSDQGVSFGTKSCNYNLIQSRWEDLSGNVEVCECCSSKCKGLSIKHLPEDAKASISAGPFVIVDKLVEMRPDPSVSEPQETSSTPVIDSMQSDRAAAEQTIVSGISISRLPQSVVVVHQEDPVARLTVWLPGQVQSIEHSKNSGSESEDNLTLTLHASDTETKDLPELRPLATEPLLNTPANKVGDLSSNELSDSPLWDLSLLTLVNGWPIHPQTGETASPEESQRVGRFERSDAEAPREIDIPQNVFSQMRDELAAEMPQEETNDAQPIIHSKLQFSKSTDGSQTLSYEEEVMRQQEGKGVTRRFGIQRKLEPRQRGLRSTFLDLLRKMDKAE